MIDVGRRRDEQRLRRAQEIADCARDRRAEMLLEIRDRVLRLHAEPIRLDTYRRTGSLFGDWSLPDDVC